MIILANQETREIMTRLIRADFDKIDFTQEYIYDKAAVLIRTAKAIGLTELSVDMETDKQTELC